MNDSPPPLTIGNQFGSMRDLRLACKRVALLDNFEFKTIASDKKRYTIHGITADGCPWRLCKDGGTEDQQGRQDQESISELCMLSI